MDTSAWAASMIWTRPLAAVRAKVAHSRTGVRSMQIAQPPRAHTASAISFCRTLLPAPRSPTMPIEADASTLGASATLIITGRVVPAVQVDAEEHPVGVADLRRW